MAYINDPGLEFLQHISSEDLNELVHLLTHDEDGKLRITEKLTKSELYKAHFPNHKLYWKEIAEELQLFGGVIPPKKSSIQE